MKSEWIDDPRVRMLLDRPEIRKEPFTVYIKLCEIGSHTGGVISDSLDDSNEHLLDTLASVCGLEEDDFLSAISVLEGVGLLRYTEEDAIRLTAVRAQVSDPDKPAPMSDAERARRYRQRKKERMQHNATALQRCSPLQALHDVAATK